MSDSAPVFLPTLYCLAQRNQLQRPAELFPGRSGLFAEKLLESGTVQEFRDELLNWGLSNTALNANRMVLQRMLFLLMQNLMLEEERLGSKCAVPSKFKGDTSETSVRKVLTQTITVMSQGTIWDLKNELQSWGLLHAHLNSGRMSLAILLKLSLRNCELGNLPCEVVPAPVLQPAPAYDAATTPPPKHQAESPATAPAAKRLCVDVSDASSNIAQSLAISPLLLCAALNCASAMSSNSQNDNVASASPHSQSQSDSASSSITELFSRSGTVQIDHEAAPTCSTVGRSDSSSPTCSQGRDSLTDAGVSVAATS